jgi:hypothetical protein
MERASRLPTPQPQSDKRDNDAQPLPERRVDGDDEHRTRTNWQHHHYPANNDDDSDESDITGGDEAA